MKYLKFLYKHLLIIPLLYSLSSSNQLDTLKHKEGTEVLLGYKYELVGEFPDSLYEKAFEEYDFDGDGIVDRCGEDLEGVVALWAGFREDESLPEGVATDFKLKGFIAIIEPWSSNDIKFWKNEQGQIDLLVKYWIDDTVKVLLYRDKSKIENAKPK